MKPYKLKHILSGLYYQPHKYGGSHLSKTGKIYQTKINGLSSCISGNYTFFRIYCQYDSQIYKLTKDKLDWSDVYGQVYVDTKFEDWIIEEI